MIIDNPLHKTRPTDIIVFEKWGPIKSTLQGLSWCFSSNKLSSTGIFIADLQNTSLLFFSYTSPDNWI